MTDIENNTENEYFKGARRGERRIPLGDSESLAAKLRGTPYYWWYQTLKASRAYRECCKNQGKGWLSKIYDDFGDVMLPWPIWINKYGKDIFTERNPFSDVKALSQQDLRTAVVNRDTLILEIPMTVTVATLMRKIKKQILLKHPGRKLDVHAYGTSKRPLLKSRVQVEMIELLLNVHHERQLHPDYPLWKVGERAGVKIAYMSKSGESNRILTIEEEKRRMAIVTSGYLNKARWLIDNAEQGMFPLTRQPTHKDFQRARIKP